MTQEKGQKPTARQKRVANKEALARFALFNLWSRLPLSFPLDPDLPPSPKPRYRSQYRYLGPEDLHDPQTLETLSSFDLALRLIDYSNLERPWRPTSTSHRPRGKSPSTLCPCSSCVSTAASETSPATRRYAF